MNQRTVEKYDLYPIPTTLKKDDALLFTSWLKISLP